MYKRLIVSGVLLMLMVSVSPGAAVNEQDYLIGALNAAGLGASQGVASNANVTTVGQSQLSSDDWGLTKMYQGQVGALGQAAGAGGMGGVFMVTQEGRVLGEQDQLHAGGPANLGLQTQLANVGLSQDVTKLGGVGVAFGLQTFVGAQVQIVATPYGFNINVQPVAVTVFDAVR